MFTHEEQPGPRLKTTTCYCPELGLGMAVCLLVSEHV